LLFSNRTPQESDNQTKVNSNDTCLSIVNENNELKVSHSPPLTYPPNQNSFNVQIIPNQINAEKLLLKVIGIHIYSLIMKLFEQLKQLTLPPIKSIDVMIPTNGGNSHIECDFIFV
jgi:hypothetical protein